MDSYERKITAKLWIYEGPSPWYFVTIPRKEASLIRREFRHVHRGWGSIPVRITLGSTSWKTSIFWEKKGTYLLPIKKEVRRNEKITSGDSVTLILTIENTF